LNANVTQTQFLFFLLLCVVWVHCSIYKGSYNVSNISYMNSNPPLLSFIPLPWFLEQFQQVSFCTIFILLPLSPTLLPPVPTLPYPIPCKTCSVHPPDLWFCRRKNIKDKKRNMIFLLVWGKDDTDGVSLCCFHPYMYYNLDWFVSSLTLHSSLVHFPWWPRLV
jgi:hypothetical protein